MHPFGKNAQHGLEQILVAQHHRRAPMRRFVGRQMPIQPSAHTLRLRRLARGGHHFDLLDVPKIIEAFSRQSVGELSQILLDEQSRFEASALVTIGIIAVVVPVEAGFPGLLHKFKQALFGFVEYIEAHHGIAIHVGRQLTTLLCERIDHSSVERTLIGLSFGEQLGVERAVKRQKGVPQSAKTLPQLAFAIGVEVRKEAPDEFFLRFGEEVRVFQLFEFLEIAKQLRGVGHILIHIVEVGQYAVGPPVEGVEREFVGRHIARTAQHFHIVRIETAHTVDRIVERHV